MLWVVLLLPQILGIQFRLSENIANFGLRNVTVEKALEVIGSAHVKKLFVEKDKDKLAKAINRLFKQEWEKRDALELNCRDTHYQFALKLVRSTLDAELAKRQRSLASRRLGSVQEELADLQLSIASRRQQFLGVKKRCWLAGEEGRKMAAKLRRDVHIGDQLLKAVSAVCDRKQDVPLLLCELPCGSRTVIFENKDLKNMTLSKLSTFSSEIFSRSLDRSINQTLLQPVEKNQSKASSFLERQRVTELKAELKQCMKLKGEGQPSCGKVEDLVATGAGNLHDAKDLLLAKAGLLDLDCANALQEINLEVKHMTRQTGDLNVDLVKAAEQKTAVFSDTKSVVWAHEALVEKARAEEALCRDQLSLSLSKMEAFKRIRLAAGLDHSSAFMGDCEVSEWMFGSCSAQCGGGKMNVSREIIDKLSEGAPCPPLLLERKCNSFPCGKDCQMSRWGEWTECSQQCGGGTQSRSREIVTESSGSGLPCGDVSQERICGRESCDKDCVLSDWSSWSSCSRFCGKGVRIRTRSVVEAPAGQGKCPELTSVDRRERQDCRLRKKCPLNMMASGRADLLLLVDKSASMGAKGLENLKAMLLGLLRRIDWSGMRVGVVSFGSSARVDSPFSHSEADLAKAVKSLQFESRGATNMGAGLALARQLALKGRRSVRSLVLVLTDGMPTRKVAADDEVRRLKSGGSRLLFLAIGEALNKRVLARWASWPSSENLVRLVSLEALGEPLTTQHLLDRLLVRIAPQIRVQRA